MGHDHHQASVAWIGVESTLAIVLVVAALAYGFLARRLRGSWPVWRSILWAGGLGCIAAGMIGPLARATATGFTEHMWVHLLIGMIGPLLLVLAAPITLALRVLPTGLARLLTRVLGSRPVRVLSHPVTAALLNTGGAVGALHHGVIPPHACLADRSCAGASACHHRRGGVHRGDD